MKADVRCPYCGADQYISHDDGYGYEEGVTHHQECGACEKSFAYTTRVMCYYEAAQAACLNGGQHDYRPVVRCPRVYPDMKRCRACGHIDYGEYRHNYVANPNANSSCGED